VIVSNSGAKRVGRTILGFGEATAIAWHAGAPGKPIQNAVVGSMS